MNLDYIIVQAGGKGSRMGQLTVNKPKALVPVNNLPIIFHLFRKYPDKNYIIIGDYKYDVLVRYLYEFAEVKFDLICASGHYGTCAGIREAISYIPENKRFMLIWCDLVLPKDYELPNSENNIIGISKDFSCRWRYENQSFSEVTSKEHGVAGFFVFNNKSYLERVPLDGEFVRWLQEKKFIFEEQGLYKTHEYGLYEEWDKLPQPICRPFNKIRFEEDQIIKTAIDEQGKKLAIKEVAWYLKLKEMGFGNIPEIYSWKPLCMERIRGKNIYEYIEIDKKQKKKMLDQIIFCLKRIHELDRIPADKKSYRVAYLDKTFDRLKKVEHLVPFADKPFVIVNGRKCRNIFFHKNKVEELVMEYCPSEFKLIHGDCTFSNIIMKNDETPILIDPRGYFGTTELFGDTAYDWAKLYYSLFSNYDQFNLKHFKLEIHERGVNLMIASNNWECMEDDFFDLLEGQVTRKQMKLLLAIIWLSLTTYAWDDYDSVCGAFYNGLYYLEEALQ